MAKVEQKHLEGMTYKTSKPKKGEDGKTKYIAVERPLQLDDLLDQRDTGDSFVVATKDGKKYVIPKAGKPAKDAKAGAGDGK